MLAGCKSAAADNGDAAASDDASSGDAGVPVDAHENVACEAPLAPEVVEHTLVVNVPSDADPTANPTPTTAIAAVPGRCVSGRAREPRLWWHPRANARSRRCRTSGRSISVTGVELPIVVRGVFPGSHAR